MRNILLVESKFSSCKSRNVEPLSCFRQLYSIVIDRALRTALVYLQFHRTIQCGQISSAVRSKCQCTVVHFPYQIDIQWKNQEHSSNHRWPFDCVASSERKSPGIVCNCIKTVCIPTVYVDDVVVSKQ